MGAADTPDSTGTQALPPYVEYGSRVSAPPPVVCKGGSFMALVVNGEQAKVEALVQRVLTVPAPAPVEYRPLVEQMLLLVGSFGELGSEALGFTDWGSVAETHLSIWLPVVRGSNVGGIFMPERLGLAIPYIIVDNPLSYAGGREDYGYPKAMGRFTPENGAGDSIELEVFGGNFGTHRRAGWVRLMTALRKGAERAPAAAGAAAGGASPWHDEAELLPYIDQLNGGMSPQIAHGFSIRDVVAALLSGLMQQVALKQVRDASSADVACYRTVLEMPVKLSNLSWRVPGASWEVQVETIQSHPLGEDLGLGTQTAPLALEVKFDATLEPGTPVVP